MIFGVVHAIGERAETVRNICGFFATDGEAANFPEIGGF
jgi:hypothetical protein